MVSSNRPKAMSPASRVAFLVKLKIFFPELFMELAAVLAELMEAAVGPKSVGMWCGKW